MQNYVILLCKNLEGDAVEGLGSFCRMKVDGRSSIHRYHATGKALMDSENAVSNGYYIGYRVYRGGRPVAERVYS